MSRLLVALQFLLIALIAAPFSRPLLTFANVALFATGLVVFAAALSAMKLKTFTVMPDPKAGGELITAGIYRFIRHPMYLSVLLCAIAACLAYGSGLKWIFTIALAAVLIVKIRYEEKLLMVRFDGYSAYRNHSKALIPFVF